MKRIKIVVLEPLDSTREFLENLLRENFDVEVRSITQKEYEGDVVSLLWAEKPYILIISAEVRPWYNERYPKAGTKLLQDLRSVLPQVLFIFTAIDPVYIDKAVSINACHVGFLKEDLAQIVEPIHLHLDIIS